jgi:hypothetical protein
MLQALPAVPTQDVLRPRLTIVAGTVVSGGERITEDGPGAIDHADRGGPL